MSVTTGAGAQTITFSGSGQPVLTDTHVGGTKLGNMGAYVHPTTGGALEIRGGGKMSVGGRLVPFVGKSLVTARSVGKAVGALLTGPVGLALFAIPTILELLDDSGMTYDPVTKTVSASGNYWHVYAGSCLYQTSREAAALCGAMATWAGTTANQWDCNVTTGNTMFCQFLDIPTSRSYTVEPEMGAAWGGVQTAQQIEDAIANTGVSDAAVLGELYANNQPVDVENIVLSEVPEVVQGPVNVATAPNGDTTTTDTQWECTTTGNVVACNQVVTRTLQPAGIDPVTSLPYEPEVTTETSNDVPTENDACAANPTRVGCAVLDTPTGDIPTKEVTVTFSPEDLGLGNGGCPAPIGFNVATGNYSINLSSWCDAVETWVRPLVIAIATLMAFMIAWPRGES